MRRVITSGKAVLASGKAVPADRCAERSRARSRPRRSARHPPPRARASARTCNPGYVRLQPGCMGPQGCSLYCSRLQPRGRVSAPQPCRAQAPAVARSHARKAVLGNGLVQRVAHRGRDGEELLGGLDAYGVPPLVLRAGAAEAVAVEAGTDARSVHVSAAALQLCACSGGAVAQCAAAQACWAPGSSAARRRARPSQPRSHFDAHCVNRWAR